MITDKVTLGATWQSKTSMSEFDDYKGLFAEKGDFDIPSNWGLGIAFKATPKFTIAADYMRINYSDVASINNTGPTTNTAAQQGALLGDNKGMGFGWEDMDIFKLGLSYEVSPAWTVMGGWNHGGQPISKSETLFNILAPGVVEDHLTLGATWKMSPGRELTFTYMHAFENTVKGSGSIPPGFPPGMGGGEADITMYQNSLGIAFGMAL